MKLEIELAEQITTDTITGEIVNKSVLIISRQRSIYIGINTLVKIAEFLKEKGIKIGL